MVPVLIKLQVKHALKAAAGETALSDITKKKIIERIMSTLDAENKSQMCQMKDIEQDDISLSIKIEPETNQTMILREKEKRWSLIIKRNSEGNKTEFIIDTYRKINIILG